MGVSILVLREKEEAYTFSEKLAENPTSIVSIELVQPYEEKSGPLNAKDKALLKEESNSLIKCVEIDNVKLLNPKLSQKERQRTMSFWLMPFGLVAGITFSGMTSLDTFAKLGFGKFGEILLGGLLGMVSGLIGSFFAASSVNPYQKDIDSLRKRHEQGKWLLILKTSFEGELPWGIIKEVNPIELVTLNEL